MEGLWSTEEFVKRLRAVGEAKYHDRHPFQLRMNEGRLSPEQFRRWVLNRFYYQKNIPIKDAIVLSRLPTREDRREWLQRIIDHDGRRQDEGGIEAWLCLGEAAGLSRDRMLDDAGILPGVRFAVDGYLNFCRLQSWPEAVASSLTELFAPDLVAHRIQVIERHYSWVRPEGLRYFHQRLNQAPRDVDHALGLVIRSAKTRRDQELAIAALSFKCDVLWSLLDAIDGHCHDHAADRVV
ncbi:MAG TPA: pyrroloquinoline-quinone synthase PqqC [Blastocatellia bacterium]|nr:pyrroloquinoline-quinone synthase PqqC [Blastocatellia bacterium]